MTKNPIGFCFGSLISRPTNSEPDVGAQRTLLERNVFAHVGRKIKGDDVFGNAAQLAYYFLLALFPLLIFFLT